MATTVALRRGLLMCAIVPGLFWMACGEPPEEPPMDSDSGSPLALDAGREDAGEPDAGQPDAGEPDAGEEDAGAADAGSQQDAGIADAGTPDAGQSAICSACHGSAANPAPPTDTSGQTSTTLRTVGAHQSHLRASTWRAPIACSDCHVVPASPSAPGHIDAAPAEVVFSPLATANGTFTAAWDGTTCSAYCHGSSMSAGGTNATPEWTSVDAGEVYCGSCHALPPAGGHPQNANCVGCHPQVMNTDNVTFKNPALHVNGVKDRQ